MNKKASTKTTTDGRVNFLSATFDAAYALSTPGVQPPVRGAIARDHIGLCRSLLLPSDPHYAPPVVAVNRAAKAKAAEEEENKRRAQQEVVSAEEVERQRELKIQCDQAVRRFTTQVRVPKALSRNTTLHSIPPAVSSSASSASSSSFSPSSSLVYGSFVRAGTAATIAVQKDEEEEKKAPTGNKMPDGPLRLLRSILIGRRKCTVTVRRVHGIRGTCTGYLKLFDKQWNVVLQDVDEEYIVIAYGHPKLLSDVPPLHLLSPHRTRTKTKQFHLKRQRHMKQVLLRGENIVTVVAAPHTAPRQRPGLR